MRTAKYYLGGIWPNLKVSAIRDYQTSGTIIELKLANERKALALRRLFFFDRGTMQTFDLDLKRFYKDFYDQARVAIVLNSFVVNDLKPLTPQLEYGII